MRPRSALAWLRLHGAQTRMRGALSLSLKSIRHFFEAGSLPLINRDRSEPARAAGVRPEYLGTMIRIRFGLSWQFYSEL